MSESFRPRPHAGWRIRHRASAPVAAVALLVSLLGFAACSRRGMPGLDLPVTKLSNDFEPLRAEFNHDAGKVRMLLLLDPT